MFWDSWFGKKAGPASNGDEARARHFAVSKAVASAMQQLRSWSLDRVRSVNDFSAKEVIAAGSALERIVEEARTYVRIVRGALEQIGGSVASRTDALGTIERQSAAVTNHVLATGNIVEKQNAIASDAVQQLDSARKLGRRIASISSDARMLALNASIEAARIGRGDSRASTSGSAFDVIAAEMSNFAKTVHAANQDMIAIIDHLGRVVGQLADNASELRGLSDAFAIEYDAQSSELAELVRQLRSAVTESLGDGDVRVERILTESQSALSHLQFQDTCAQQLLHLDADIAQIAGAVEKAVRDEDPKATSGLASASSHRALAAGHVAALESGKGKDAPKAPPTGDVLLF